MPINVCVCVCVYLKYVCTQDTSAFHTKRHTLTTHVAIPIVVITIIRIRLYTTMKAVLYKQHNKQEFAKQPGAIVDDTRYKIT